MVLETQVNLITSSFIPKHLSNKEYTTLNLISRGLPRKEINKIMGVTGNTTKNRLTTIFTKLNAVNAPHAVRIAIDMGIFPPQLTDDTGIFPPQDNYLLTEREREILSNVSLGKTNKEIGFELEIVEHTVKNHITHILKKLNANDRTHAVIIALRSKLIKVEGLTSTDRPCA